MGVRSSCSVLLHLQQPHAVGKQALNSIGVATRPAALQRAAARCSAGNMTSRAKHDKHQESQAIHWKHRSQCWAPQGSENKSKARKPKAGPNRASSKAGGLERIERQPSLPVCFNSSNGVLQPSLQPRSASRVVCGGQMAAGTSACCCVTSVQHTAGTCDGHPASQS